MHKLSATFDVVRLIVLIIPEVGNFAFDFNLVRSFFSSLSPSQTHKSRVSQHHYRRMFVLWFVVKTTEAHKVHMCTFFPHIPTCTRAHTHTLTQTHTYQVQYFGFLAALLYPATL